MAKYDLELNKAIEKIKKSKAKLVCIQLPDGLKSKARDIQTEIESNTSAKVIIWLGSCYGACDIPLHIKKQGIDLLIQWGHSEWKY
ncbi:MAG: diphthamide synthesis protein [Candidatus Woesearchaeota archaeon]